jgi:hypothetical protein
MKIAIPTSDGINIGKNLIDSTSYLIFYVQFGEIIDEEVRPILFNNILTDEECLLSPIDDCSVIISDGMNENIATALIKKKKEVVHTGESNITKIVMNYLNNSLLKESNTLCCP